MVKCNLYEVKHAKILSENIYQTRKNVRKNKALAKKRLVTSYGHFL